MAAVANKKRRKFRILLYLDVPSYTPKKKHCVIIMRRFGVGVFSHGWGWREIAQQSLPLRQPKHSGGKMWNSCRISSWPQNTRTTRQDDSPPGSHSLPRVYESHLAAFKFCQASELIIWEHRQEDAANYWWSSNLTCCNSGHRCCGSACEQEHQTA